jgi:hypothetical protein
MPESSTTDHLAPFATPHSFFPLHSFGSPGCVDENSHLPPSPLVHSPQKAFFFQTPSHVPPNSVKSSIKSSINPQIPPANEIIGQYCGYSKGGRFRRRCGTPRTSQRQAQWCFQRSQRLKKDGRPRFCRRGFDLMSQPFLPRVFVSERECRMVDGRRVLQR